MMDGATLAAVNRAATRRAQREGREPCLFDGDPDRVRVPYIGDRTPRGWRRTDRDLMFVDTSGFGREGEPAMTQRAFLASLRPGYGYGIVEQGQFQAYVAEFEPRRSRRAA